MDRPGRQLNLPQSYLVYFFCLFYLTISCSFLLLIFCYLKLLF
uniref:Uncharacterized protein n=1 Tax=Anguilla anguilla TaxID=7936 RepID=A0A0E9S9N9_ANGAN